MKIILDRQFYRSSGFYQPIFETTKDLFKPGPATISFFSYRAFPTWQQAVEQAIATTQTIPQFEYLEQIVEYDLVQFPYPVEMADAIWDALKNRQSELLAAKRAAEIEQSPAAKPALSLASSR